MQRESSFIFIKHDHGKKNYKTNKNKKQNKAKNKKIELEYQIKKFSDSKI